MTDAIIRIVGDEIACDWGVIANPDGNPALPVGPLMVVTGGVVRSLLRDGPSMDKYGNVNSVRYAEGSFLSAERDVLKTSKRHCDGCGVDLTMQSKHIHSDSTGAVLWVKCNFCASGVERGDR